MLVTLLGFNPRWKSSMFSPSSVVMSVWFSRAGGGTLARWLSLDSFAASSCVLILVYGTKSLFCGRNKGKPPPPQCGGPPFQGCHRLPGSEEARAQVSAGPWARETLTKRDRSAGDWRNNATLWDVNRPWLVSGFFDSIHSIVVTSDPPPRHISSGKAVACGRKPYLIGSYSFAYRVIFHDSECRGTLSGTCQWKCGDCLVSAVSAVGCDNIITIWLIWLHSAPSIIGAFLCDLQQGIPYCPGWNWFFFFFYEEGTCLNRCFLFMLWFRLSSMKSQFCFVCFFFYIL